MVLSIKITDDLIAFPGEGEERNLSAWIKGWDTVQEAWVNDVKVDVVEARKLVDKEFCISIRMLPLAAETWSAHLDFVPLSPQELVSVALERGVADTSRHVPRSELEIGAGPGRKVSIVPFERPDMK